LIDHQQGEKQQKQDMDTIFKLIEGQLQKQQQYQDQQQQRQEILQNQQHEHLAGRVVVIEEKTLELICIIYGLVLSTHLESISVSVRRVHALPSTLYLAHVRNSLGRMAY
jgi:hypothetical protein